MNKGKRLMNILKKVERCFTENKKVNRLNKQNSGS